MSAVITLQDVTKKYESFLLSIPKLEIPEGYITGFIGENGAGKTTTLRLIMDILTPNDGKITVLGGDMHKNPDLLKQEIGYVDSLCNFTPNAKVGLAKKIVAPFYSGWDEDLYRKYVKRFSIKEDAKIKTLSSGQVKLFSLVMALCHRPRLLILDEPTANLDPVVRSEILDILSDQMQDSGISILFSTHITSDLDKIADYIAYIQAGKLLLFEEKDRMLEEFRVVKGACDLLPEAGALLMNPRTTEVGFTALARDADAVREKFGDNLIFQRPTLEDIMIYTAKEGTHRA